MGWTDSSSKLKPIWTTLHEASRSHLTVGAKKFIDNSVHARKPCWGDGFHLISNLTVLFDLELMVQFFYKCKAHTIHSSEIFLW